MNNHFPCKAAFAQTDITPDFPVEMIGCYRPDDRPRGVLHPIFAQVLLFETDDQRYCLTAIDSLGLTTELANTLRARVADALDTERSRVMLNFSHTHSAPAPRSPLNGARYFELLCARVAACAGTAREQLAPCRVGWAVGDVDIGENRRAHASVVDRRLGGLRIARVEDDRPIATLLRVCAHANVLMTHSDRLSSDYFGSARDKLSLYWACPVMLFQGAAGNIKPVGVDKVSGGGWADVERVSDMLVRSAKQLHFVMKDVVRLAMREMDTAFLSDVPAAAEAEKIVRASGMEASGWLEECARLRAAGIISQRTKGSIQFFFLNEGCLCGVPDEIFCELAIEAAERCDAPLLFFNGYTNGCTGYLPTEEEWNKGGYEPFDSYLFSYVFHGHVYPFRPDTAGKLVDLVVGAWNAG